MGEREPDTTEQETAATQSGEQIPEAGTASADKRSKDSIAEQGDAAGGPTPDPGGDITR